MEIKFRESKIDYDDGWWLKIKLESPTDRLRLMQLLKDQKTFAADIRMYRKKRSLDANAMFWAMLNELSGKMGIDKIEIYRSYVREIGGNATILSCRSDAVESFIRGWERTGLGWIAEEFPAAQSGYSNVMAYFGSSTYDTAQMSRLIDLCIQDCRSVGIITPEEDRINSLLEEWDAHRNQKNIDS